MHYFWVLEHLHLQLLFLELCQVVEVVNHEKVLVTPQIIKIFRNVALN